MHLLACSLLIEKWICSFVYPWVNFWSHWLANVGGRNRVLQTSHQSGWYNPLWIGFYFLNLFSWTYNPWFDNYFNSVDSFKYFILCYNWQLQKWKYSSLYFAHCYICTPIIWVLKYFFKYGRRFQLGEKAECVSFTAMRTIPHSFKALALLIFTLEEILLKAKTVLNMLDRLYLR